MKKITIGTKGEFIDLDLLLVTRMLVQANSGGGKGYLLRKLIEQLFGHVQVIIIDPEGEFSSLREKFDFILVGKEGETPADVRSAGMLAQKLLELNASAICDLYEMKSMDRHVWVNEFLKSLIDAPKKLWHPVVVVVDEAHIFAPEKGQGESVALEAMTDLASRGRKRGFCAVFATQRLGKISKNVTAELQNVLIGSTFQDIDRKRAAETMGIPKSNEREFFNEIKMLEPGNFYALGRAISKETIVVKIDRVLTTHPKSGAHVRYAPPAPSDRIKTLLPQLQDLPAQAEQKQKTEAELRKELADLKKKMATMHDGQVEQIRIEVPTIDEKMMERVEKYIDKMNSENIRHENNIGKVIRMENERHQEAMRVIQNAWSLGNREIVDAFKEVKFDKPALLPPPKIRPESIKLPIVRQHHGTISNAPGEKLPVAEKKILNVLAQYPDGREKTQIAILAAYSHKGGGFNNSLSSLRSKQFIITNGEISKITQDGINALGSYTPLPTGSELQEHWMNSNKLGKAEKTILRYLCSIYPATSIKENIGEATGYESKGGGFNNALSRLRSLELITKGEVISASVNLFD